MATGKSASVISLMPWMRLEAAQVTLPKELDVLFSQDYTPEGIITACRGRDFLFVPAAYPPITRPILEGIPSIRLIQSSGIGYDKVDAVAAAEIGIPVANVPAENITTVAEFTVAAWIALQRRMCLADRRVKAGDYVGIREIFFKSGLREVADTRLGLVGLGGSAGAWPKSRVFSGPGSPTLTPTGRPKPSKNDFRPSTCLLINCSPNAT